MKDYSGYLGDAAPATAGGRHMIGPLEELVRHNRAKAKAMQRRGEDEMVEEYTAWADVLDTARACILAEAARADRAERAHNAHSLTNEA